MALTKYEATGNYSPRQMMQAVHGLYKSGKSHYLLTAPDPLRIANFDHEIEFLLNELCVGKELMLENLWPAQSMVSQTDVDHLLNRFEFVVGDALKAGKGSLIIDGASKLYNLLQLKFLGVSYASGKPQEGGVAQFQWARIYQYLTNLLQPFQRTECNILMSFESKKEYKDATATGALVPRGPEAIGYTIHMQLQCFTKTQREAVVAGVGPKPTTCVICQAPLGRGQHTEYWARIDWTAYRDGILRNREIVNPTFDKVKTLVSLTATPAAEAVLAPVEAEPTVDISKIGGSE